MRPLPFRTAIHLSLSTLALAAACAPGGAACPAGFTLGADGRCLAAAPGGDGGLPPVDAFLFPGDADHAPDASFDAGSDGGTMPTIDAGTMPENDAGTMPEDDAAIAMMPDVGVDACVLTTFYGDHDGDGYGDPTDVVTDCHAPAGYVATGGDCNDACPACHPGGAETCDGILDENCSAGVDDGCECTNGHTQPCGVSAVAPCRMGTATCVSGHWASCVGNVDPLAETCNGADDDCNGTPDDGLPTHTYYGDGDMDGYGGTLTMVGCRMPAGYVTLSGDCDDANAARSPAVSETCNGVDDDCDLTPDDGLPTQTYYVDGDVDGWGGTATMVSCRMPAGYVARGGDCNDSSMAVSPGASETCNGHDDDCSGTGDTPTFACTQGATVTCTTACGSTGTGVCTAGCALPSTCTAPAEICNGTDDNCDGVADERLASTLGSPVTGLASGTTNATSYQATHLVPTSTGYVLFAQTRESPSHLVMQSLRADGTPSGTATALDSRLTPGGGAPWAVRASGGGFLVTYGYLGAGSTGTLTVAQVNATGGTVSFGTLPLPAGYSAYTRSIVTRADGTFATIYAALRSTATPYVYTITRFLVNVSASAPTVSGAPFQVVSDLSIANVFEGVFTSFADYLVYLDTAGVVRLVSVAGSTATPVGQIAAAVSPAAVAVAIGIADVAAQVSTSNPLGIVWLDSTGAASPGAHFVEVRRTAPFALGTPVSLGGSTGGSVLLVCPRLLDIAAVPNGSGGTTQHSSHWLVFSSEMSGATSAERAWEVLGGSGAPAAYALTVPSSQGASGDVSLAVGTSGLRVAQATTAHAAVTRQIGCR